jgi:hypothetical protein
VASRITLYADGDHFGTSFLSIGFDGIIDSLTTLQSEILPESLVAGLNKCVPVNFQTSRTLTIQSFPPKMILRWKSGWLRSVVVPSFHWKHGI